MPGEPSRAPAVIDCAPSHARDVEVLRDLARQVRALATSDRMSESRNLWRDHNSLLRSRVPVYMRWFATAHEIVDPHLACEDPLLRGHERRLRQLVFQGWLEDDYTIEPWHVVGARRVLPEDGPWGVSPTRTHSSDAGGAWKEIAPLQDESDFDRLVTPRHVIDEEATARDAERLHDAIGDILPIVVDRAPAWMMWRGDLSTDIAHLRGLEQIMWDMYDNPAFLHRLLAFMRDGVLAAHEQAEAAGDFRLIDHQNQSMPYARELPDPSPSEDPVPRSRLWGYMAAQEYTLISPELTDEFMLQYQIPILERFGLSAYGCCEKMDAKISLARKIPNLRRVAVTPSSDPATCAEQIGTDYVASWRPNPAETVCCGFDADRIRTIVREAREAFDANGTVFDVCLKDIQTVEHQPERLRDFVRIVREVCDD